MTKDNHQLDKFDLTNIPQCPGVCHRSRSAEDTGTGSKEKITITNVQTRLTPRTLRR